MNHSSKTTNKLQTNKASLKSTKFQLYILKPYQISI